MTLVVCQLTSQMNWMPCFTWSEIRRQQTWLEKKKIYKQTNKRENKHIKKKTTSKNYDDYCSLFFLRNSNVLPSINLATLTITKKTTCYSIFPVFSKTDLHKKKNTIVINPQLSHHYTTFATKRCLLNNVLKKRKKKHKRTTATIPKKLKQSIGDSLSAYYKIITHTLTASFFHQVLTYRYITSTYY